MNVRLKFKIEELANEGVLFSAANIVVYGYKHKIKASDRLKKDNFFNRNETLLFKRRIYASRDHALRIFAEMKLLSLLEIGPYIGRMADGSDGYLTKDYLEFFGEATLSTRITP